MSFYWKTWAGQVFLSKPTDQTVLWPTQLVTCMHWVPFIISNNYPFLVSAISPGVKRTWREADYSSRSVPKIYWHFPIWLHGVEINKQKDNVPYLISKILGFLCRLVQPHTHKTAQFNKRKSQYK